LKNSVSRQPILIKFLRKDTEEEERFWKEL